MVAVGVTVGEMSKSFQSRLIDDNTRATHLVELTARIERRLYQSLVYLSAVKDVEDEIVGSITMDGPNFEILSKSFNAEVDAINGNIVELEQLLIGNSCILVVDFNVRSESFVPSSFKFFNTLNKIALIFSICALYLAINICSCLFATLGVKDTLDG